MSELVTYRSENRIATITINRADKRNALNQALCDELHQAYCAFEAGPDQVAVLQADVLNLFITDGYCPKLHVRSSICLC